MTKIIQTLVEAIASFNTSECVRNYDGHILECFTISTDLNIWAGREVTTANELEEWINFERSYSDTYKDAHGVRPRFDWSDRTLSEWHTEYAYLADEILREIEREDCQEEQSKIAFEELLANVIEIGANTRKRALKWIFDGDCDSHGIKTHEYFLWDHDISTHKTYGQQMLQELQNL